MNVSGRTPLKVEPYNLKQWSLLPSLTQITMMVFTRRTYPSFFEAWEERRSWLSMMSSMISSRYGDTA